MISIIDRFIGSLIGLACGDAVGTTVEFKQRGSFFPVTDMVGGGPFKLRPGEWTDDTSMALCLASSLLESKGFDPDNQMRKYVDWWKNGYMSSTGYCFDIGHTTLSAIEHYQFDGEAFSGSTDPYSAGNGSIMRLAPIILYYYPDLKNILFYSRESSRTTHAAEECLDACQLMGEIIYRALEGRDKQEILRESDYQTSLSLKIQAIASGKYKERSRDQIEGSGYVVESLEAALWCFWTTDNFESAILEAVNLGNDADTTAAVCGQIAGAYYGIGGIPSRWIEKLAKGNMIKKMAEDLLQKS
jgi:ADP-ribosyl-[dinitrogen reductase] hydrolase